ncbi:hypothetical protein E4T56_gene19099 [Termitomyces sp. T112]|nr:hypothetical protein E4T56_gene19099 [Termitomyces sp. T112]
MPRQSPTRSPRLEGLNAEGGNLPQCFIELPQHSVPTLANSDAFLANSDSPLANSNIFPTATSTSPGLPELLGPLPHHA